MRQNIRFCTLATDERNNRAMRNRGVKITCLISHLLGIMTPMDDFINNVAEMYCDRVLLFFFQLVPFNLFKTKCDKTDNTCPWQHCDQWSAGRKSAVLQDNKLTFNNNINMICSVSVLFEKPG